MVVVSPSPQRIQQILNNLVISFTNCKFTYSKLDNINLNKCTSATTLPRAGGGNHLGDEVVRPTNRRKSTLASIQKWVHDTTSDIFHDSTEAKQNAFVNCIFPPGEEEDIKDHITTYENEHTKFQFTNCTFIKRELNFIEDLIRKFKRILGLRFELDFVSGAVLLEGKKCKLKDIPWIVQMVIQQIQEETPSNA